MNKRKILSMVLCVLLLLSVMPLTAWADDTTEAETEVIIVGYKEPIAGDRVADYLEIKAYGADADEESSFFTVSEVSWKSGDEALTASDTFTADKDYSCSITLTPKDGVAVDINKMNVAFMTCGQILNVPAFKGMNQDNTVSLTVFTAAEKRDSHSITFINTTEASGGSAMLCDHSATAAPKAGQEVFVFCNTGFKFDAVSPSNLIMEPVNKWGMDGFHFLMPDNDVTLTIAKEEVPQDIVISDVNAKLVNKSALNTAAVPLAGKKSEDYTVRMNAGDLTDKISFTSHWTTAAQQDKILSNTDTFVEGEEYTLVINLRPDEGYTFDESTSFTINGESVRAIIDETSVTIQKKFTAIADVDVHETPTGWRQMWTVGGDLRASSIAYPAYWLYADESGTHEWSNNNVWQIVYTHGHHHGEAAISSTKQNTTIWTQPTKMEAGKKYLLTFMGLNVGGEDAQILVTTDDGKNATVLTSAEYTAQKSNKYQHGYWTKYTIPLSGDEYSGQNVRIGIKKLATTNPVTVDCFYMYNKAELKLATVGYTAGGNVADFRVTAEDSNIKDISVKIYNYDAETWKVDDNPTTDTVFSSDKNYRAYITVNYVDFDTRDLQKENVTVDGNPIRALSQLENKVEIQYNLPPLQSALEKIDKIEITFDESAFKYGAVYGEVLKDFNIKVSPELNFTAHFEIYEKGEPLDRYYDRESSYFFPYYKSFYLKDGYDYYLFLEIDYDGYDVSALKKENITFNGKPVYMALNSKTYKTIQPYFKLSPAPLTKPENQTIIDKITISGISAPYVGEHPQTDGARVSEGEVLIRDFNNDGNIDWFEVGDSGNGKIYKAMTENDTFELGKTYACRVPISPKDGTYAFKTVTENGEILPGARMSIITTDGKTRQAEAMQYAARTQVWSEQEQDYIQGDDIDYGYDEQLWLLREFVCTKKPQQSSGGGGGAVAVKYAVNIAQADGGSISADYAEADEGTAVTLNISPDSGYELAVITVTDYYGNEVKVSQSGGKYTFTMPSADVNVKAAFSQKAPQESSKQMLVLKIGDRVMTVDGKAVVLDVAPIITDNRTLVPIRAITESLGGEVQWNEKTKEITLKIDGKTLKMTIGVTLEKYGAAPIIIGNRTYVPLRFVAEEIGAAVDWDGGTKTVTIKK